MKILNYFISLIALTIFACLIFLFRASEDLDNIKVNELLSQLETSILIIFVELIFVKIAYWQSYKEKYISLVFYKISVSTKIVVLLSFSTGVMWLIIGISG